MGARHLRLSHSQINGSSLYIRQLAKFSKVIDESSNGQNYDFPQEVLTFRLLDHADFQYK